MEGIELKSPEFKGMRGAYAAMFSPFDADGRVNEAMIERLVEHGLSNDLTGFYQLRWLSKLATLPLRPRFAPQSRPTVPPLPEGRRNSAVGNFLQYAGKTRKINSVTLGSARGACSWPQKNLTPSANADRGSARTSSH